MTERAIDSIKIGKRHRKSVGDTASLAASIERDGLLHPVVITPAGKLIAGERRLRACLSLGWKRVPVRVVDIANVTRGELAENVEREPFLPSEIEAIRRTLEPIERAAAKQRQALAGGRAPGKFPEAVAKGETRDKIGAFAGISGRTVEKIKAVVAAAEAEPEKFGMLADDMDRTGRVNGVYRRLSNMQQAERIRAEPPPLPSGPYRVITADPPWLFAVRQHDPSHRAANAPYPPMAHDAICALPVAGLAHDDAVLWLWTTNHHLLCGEACDVVRAWGFRPVTLLTWGKPSFGCGERLRGQTEHCVLAVRGTPTLTLTNESTLLVAPVGEHSEKPAAFYELVESLCPAPRYLELFARRSRPNWDVWGDQAPPPAANDAVSMSIAAE